jgi:hypothetical protein
MKEELIIAIAKAGEFEIKAFLDDCGNLNIRVQSADKQSHNQCPWWVKDILINQNGSITIVGGFVLP